ncbi:hypothetical protein WJ969_09345 [Achromobacter xylosoxidans]
MSAEKAGSGPARCTIRVAARSTAASPEERSTLTSAMLPSRRTMIFSDRLIGPLRRRASGGNLKLLIMRRCTA